MSSNSLHADWTGCAIHLLESKLLGRPLQREQERNVQRALWWGSRNHKPLARGSALEAAAKSLRRNGVRLKVCEFHSILGYAGTGDVVYCDPTYRRQTRDHFDRYGADVFDWNDQKYLAYLAQRAFEREALVIISNASCFSIADLYPEASIVSSSRKKGIGNGNNGAALVEYIFILDPQRRDHEWACVGQVIRPSSRSLRSVNDFRTMEGV